MEIQNQIKHISRRSDCSISCSLDILGDKWTLLIIRNSLILGLKTFGEFQKASEKFASNILTDRLEKLVRYGIFTKTQSTKNKLVYEYEPTEMGRDLKPILLSLSQWGHKYIENTNEISTGLKLFEAMRNAKELK